MTDYGKPIGWWCPACKRQHRPWGSGANCPALIPVYAPIPEGQRPEADEPDDETVTIEAHVPKMHPTYRLVRMGARSASSWVGEPWTLVLAVFFVADRKCAAASYRWLP